MSFRRLTLALQLLAVVAALPFAAPANAQLPDTNPASAQAVNPPRADTSSPSLAVAPATDSARAVEAGAMGVRVFEEV
ncbi:MAG: hypothetical protein ACR2HZ_01480 [Gemmatimonadaceae bacterium]